MASTNFSLNDYLIIDTTGSIGIGTTTPQARLFVTSSSTVSTQPGVVFKAGTANQLGGVGLVDVQNSSGTTLLFVSGSGRVGIGTNNPQQSLHVSGDINVNSGSGIRINNTAGSGQFLRGDGTRFVSSGILTEDVPTLNQNTTGQAGSVANSATFNNGGAGAASGATFNGSSAVTISYNTIGAPSTGGTNATGTWGISITGNAGTATLLQTARNINGTSFNGGADITVPVNTTVKSDNVSYNIPFVTSVSPGNQSLFTDSATNLTYNPSTNTLTTTTFAGALSGNATSATSAGSVTNSVTFNNGGSGAASGTTFNGGSAVTVSYNTIGAPSTTGTNATGTWGISITGNASTATSATSAGSVTNSLTFSNAGSGDASGTTYNGSAAKTISYNSVGALGGSGTANYVSKFNASNTLTNSQIFDNGTSVGIGLTTGLTARLYVSGSSTSSDQTVLFKAGTPNQTGPVLEVENNLGTTLLVVSGSGNVGIGTFSPSSKLHLSGGDLRFDSNTSGIVYESGASTNNVLKHNGTRFVPGTVAYAEVTGTPTIGDATLTVGVSGTGLSISATPTFTANATSNKTITITSNATSSNTVSTLVARDANGDFNAGRINVIIDSSDTRAVTTTPETLSRAGVVFDFKQNTSNGLSDGGGAGGYHGLMTFRQYGSGTDWTGGRSHQLGFTDNDNVWHRSGTSTTWGTWYRFYHTGNLTNPTTGTGTSGYIPRFNGTSSITNSIVFDDGTNVGIGTASSIAAKLHVFGGSLQVDNGTNNRLIALSDGGNIELSRSGGNAYIDLKSTSGADYDTRIQSAGEGSQAALTFHTNGAEKMRIAPSGSATVGIGTNNPLNTLGYGWLTLNGTAGSVLTHQVNGSEQFRIQVDGVTYLNTIAAQPMVFMTSGAEVMRISSGGAAANVGIGTNNPGAKLHVRVTAPFDGIYQEGFSPTTTRWLRTFPSGSAGAFTPLVQQSDSAIIYGTTAGADLGSPGLVIGAWSNSRKGMRLDSNGNVGIGTETMSKKLVVHDSDALINGLTVGRGGVASNVGASNTALGNGAGFSLNVGYSNNTALGASALYTNAIGERNTAVGNSALLNYNPASLSGDSTAVGYSSLYNSSTGISNTAVGSYSLYSATTAQQNVAIGRDAMYNGNQMDYSVAVGVESMRRFGGSDYNVAIGYRSSYSIDKANYTTAVGALALYNMKDLDHATAIGFSALYSNTGSYNTAVGGGALFSNTSGQFNTAVGHIAGYSNTTAGGNVYFGYSAGFSNQTSERNTAIGYESLFSNTSTDNTAVGYQAGKGSTTGNYNSVVGSLSLGVNSIGSENATLGYKTLALNTTGSYNVAIGNNALGKSTKSYYNTAVGYNSLSEFLSGFSVTLSGFSVDFGNNTAVGSSALRCLSTQTGGAFLNTAIGSGAGYYLSGSYNVAVGSYDCLPFRSQNSNIFISDGAGNLRMIITGSNGNVGIGTTAPLSNLQVGSIGTLSTPTPSSISLGTSFSDTAGTNTKAKLKLYDDGSTVVNGFGISNLQLEYLASAGVSHVWYTGGTEYMRINSSGNVGMGSTNPGAKLDIIGGSPSIRLRTAASDAYGYIQFGDSATTTRNWHIGTENDGTFRFWNGNWGGGTHRASITSGGNLGIGTTTPSEKLEAFGTDAGIIVHYNGQSRGGIWALSSTRVAFASTAAGDDLVFGYTGTPGSSAAFVERMRVKTLTGRVGIGITNPDGLFHTVGGEIWIQNTDRNVTTHFNFGSDESNYISNGRSGSAAGRTYIRGEPSGGGETNIAQFYLNASNVAQVYINNLGTNTVYSNSGVLSNTSPSDSRLKKEMQECTLGLEQVIRLIPKTFRFINDPERLRYGFIAQDVKEVIPDLVTTFEQFDKDGNSMGDYYGLEKEGIWVISVNAIKELKSENDSLKSEIQSLKDQISSILTMLSNK